MSKSYIDQILLKPKKKNPYSQMRPAVKDSNFYFSNCISFNMIENLTQFKNNEINSTNLNLRLLNNLSFLFAKKKVRTKKEKLKDKLKENDKKNTKNQKSKKIKGVKDENNFEIIEGYECYIPTKRIPVFNRRPLNEKNIIRKESSKTLKKFHKEKEFKIPYNLRTINFFRPCGRFIATNANSNVNSVRKKSSLNVTKFSDKYSELSNSIAYTNTNTNIDEGNDLNDENNSFDDFSLNFAENDDNIFHEKAFINLLKTNPIFPRYVELTDLIESPFDDVFPPDIKYKSYYNIFNEFMNEEDYDDNNVNNNLNNDNNINNNLNNDNINNNLNNENNNIIINNLNIDNNNNCSNNITFLSNQENSIINLSDDMTDGNTNDITDKNQKIFITNPSIYNKIYINISDKNKFPKKPCKSGKLLKINANIFLNYNNTSIINKTSLSDDIDDDDGDDYQKRESLFAFFENDDNNPSKKIEAKIKKILPKSASKYINNMSNQYIFLMYDKYKVISKKWDEAKSFLNDKIVLKKLFIQLLKKYILFIGISSKKFYERLIKFEIHSKEKFNFEHFMNIFDIIITENNRENIRFKFLLLLDLIKKNDDNEENVDEKQMNNFFDLIGCEQVYINNFCEILGERLILRYKAIYNNPNIDKNTNDKTFNYRKIKTIMGSFLDAFDS